MNKKVENQSILKSLDGLIKLIEGPYKGYIKLYKANPTKRLEKSIMASKKSLKKLREMKSWIKQPLRNN